MQPAGKGEQEGMEGVTLVKKENYAVLTVDLPQSRNALSVPVVEYMGTLVDQAAQLVDIQIPAAR